MSNDIFEAFILFYRKWLKIIGTKCCVSWWNPKRSKNFIHKGFWSYRCIQPTSVWKDSKIEESLQKWVWFTTQINHLVGRFWNWLEPLNFQTQSTLIFRRNSCLFLGWGGSFCESALVRHSFPCFLASPNWKKQFWIWHIEENTSKSMSECRKNAGKFGAANFDWGKKMDFIIIPSSKLLLPYIQA